MGCAGSIEKDVGKFVNMKSDEIKEILIDESGRLRIYPSKEKFSMIWRSATEVHWDVEGSFLYSPKPREWSYFDWYKRILGSIKSEYGYILLLTKNTTWDNIPIYLKEEIVNYSADL